VRADTAAREPAKPVHETAHAEAALVVLLILFCSPYCNSATKKAEVAVEDTTADDLDLPLEVQTLRLLGLLIFLDPSCCCPDDSRHVVDYL
jgi:hypothetical protein